MNENYYAALIGDFFSKRQSYISIVKEEVEVRILCNLKGVKSSVKNLLKEFFYIFFSFSR